MVEKKFEKASTALRSVICTMGTYHVERDVVSTLFNWTVQPNSPRDDIQRLMVLKGKAGSGKTVVLHDLQERLVAHNVAVLGLKSDLLFVEGKNNIDDAVGFRVLEAIREKAEDSKVVLLVDQVDALSITLSKNRAPVMAINAFLQDVLKIQNVRVVVSCRPYDFEYDSAFHWMRGGQFQDCDELSIEEVEDTFRGNGIDFAIVDTETKKFLRTPLYLSIYCRLSTHKSHMVSKTKLYESWINQVIIDDVPQVTNTKLLSDCLDFVVTRMIHEQGLTVPFRAFKADYVPSRRYLIDKDVLLKDEDDMYVQFPHQTLLDYIYARFFFENGHTLELDFRDAHQGLFVRPRLKYVLDYLHEVDPKQYVCCVRKIVEEQKDNKPAFHYHLRHLAISTLASSEHLSQYDKRYICDYVYNNEEAYRTYEAFVYGKAHLQLLRNHIEYLGGLKSCGAEWRSRLINMLWRLCESLDARSEVVQTLMSISPDVIDDNTQGQFINLVNYVFPSGNELEQIKPFVDLLDTNPINLDAFTEYYKRLVAQNPSCVRERLEIYFVAYLERYKHDKFLPENIPNGIKHILEELQRSSSFEYLSFGRFALLGYSVNTLFKNDQIKAIRELITYNRHNEHYNFSDELLSGMMDVVEQCVDERVEWVGAYLRMLSETDSAACHIVAMVGWIRNIEVYHDMGFTYLRANINKSHHSSALDYYQKELFRVLFPILTAKEQDVIMDEVSKIDPDWEHTKLPYNNSNRTYPMTRIGYTRGQYYSMIPKAIIKEKRFAKAYKELQELQRKYMVIDNTEPSQIMVHEGWSTMPSSAYERMSDEDILASMERIQEDNHIDWDEPTLTGHSLKLSSMASEEPKRFLHIYMLALGNEQIPLTYITEGFSSIYARINESKSEDLLAKLIERLGTDVNHHESGLLMSVIRLADVYIKKQKVLPECLFNYIMLVAMQYDESSDVAFDKEYNQSIDINTAINRVRGAAVMRLVESTYHVPYQESVFNTFEEIADVASEVTKCAMLFEMALFVNYDRERTLKLFLRLTQNYEESLLCLPAQRLNPLYYIAKDRFDLLKDYFEHCLVLPKTHQVAVHFLYRFWLNNQAVAGDMCLQMGDRTEAAAVQLINLAMAYYNEDNKHVCEKVLYRYLSSASDEIGFAYDCALGKFQRKSETFDVHFLNEYFHSNVCAFATHNAYSLLRIMSEEEPRICLDWLCGLYDKMKQCDTIGYKIGDVLDILLKAYRRIIQFNADDALLDKAIDLLDSILLLGKYVGPLNEQLIKSNE